MAAAAIPLDLSLTALVKKDPTEDTTRWDWTGAFWYSAACRLETEHARPNSMSSLTALRDATSATVCGSNSVPG